MGPLDQAFPEGFKNKGRLGSCRWGQGMWPCLRMGTAAVGTRWLESQELGPRGMALCFRQSPGTQEIQAEFPALPLNPCVTLGKSLQLPASVSHLCKIGI